MQLLVVGTSKELMYNCHYNTIQNNTIKTLECVLTSFASESGAQQCDDAEKSSVVASQEQCSF